MKSGSASQPLSYFVLTVLGFSFWFLMAVPFASHRETYWWLAMVRSQPLSQAFGYISSTYRPLAQGATWLAFRFLDPGIFPTSVVRQALIQGIVYGLFVFAWWLIYSAAPQKRLLALIAFVAGGVFFSGYIHLFHVYGLFYVPVILTLGALLSFHASGKFEKRELWFALIAISLVFWHPFAAALFIGFYFGFYLETFRQRSAAQHLKAVAILLAGMIAIGGMVVIFPRVTTITGTFPHTAAMPLDTRLMGFLASYQTNEVNRAASLVAFLMAQLAIFSAGLSSRAKWAAAVFAALLGAVLLMENLPLLLLWLGAVLLKLLLLRHWSLFFLALTAAVLPFGGAIGSPAYVLFAVVVAVYATALGWSQAEESLSFLRPRYVTGIIVAVASVILLVRAGIAVPVVTRVANPLLAERERTYQMENILAWLHNSNYCGYGIALTESAGSPVESVENAINRRNRPPAQPQDVQLFWDTILRCGSSTGSTGRARTAVLTFGDQELLGMAPVFKIPGKYAGEAAVWILARDNER